MFGLVRNGKDVNGQGWGILGWSEIEEAGLVQNKPLGDVGLMKYEE